MQFVNLTLCHMWICFWAIFVSYVDLILSYICVICGSVFELYLCHMWICFWVIFVSYVDLFFWVIFVSYVDLFLSYICVISGSVFELYLWICFWVIFVSYVDLFLSYICVICGSVFELYLWICFWVIFVSRLIGLFDIEKRSNLRIGYDYVSHLIYKWSAAKMFNVCTDQCRYKFFIMICVVIVLGRCSVLF